MLMNVIQLTNIGGQYGQLQKVSYGGWQLGAGCHECPWAEHWLRCEAVAELSREEDERLPSQWSKK